MEPEGSVSCLQESVNGPYPALDESINIIASYFFKLNFNTLHLWPGLQSGHLPSGWAITFLYEFLISSMCATWPVHLNLFNLIASIIFSDSYKLWSSSLYIKKRQYMRKWEQQRKKKSTMNNERVSLQWIWRVWSSRMWCHVVWWTGTIFQRKLLHSTTSQKIIIYAFTILWRSYNVTNIKCISDYAV
jgi:hypothetical protein